MTEHVHSSVRRRRAFFDTSAYLAILDRNDRRNQLASTTLVWLADERFRLYTTSAMLIASHALVLSVMGNRVANRFIQDVMQSSAVIVRVRASGEERTREILYHYEDKAFSYDDAISFAVRERLDISPAFTFGSDVRQFRWTTVAPMAGGR